MDHHNHSLSTGRIEAFSDGLFAIVVTLLVFNLKIPETPVNNQQAIDWLIGLSPQLVSFALSFLIVCIFWVNHHQFFHTIKRADNSFLWFNNFLLFWLCFIPFPTAFIGKNPTNLAAVMLFGGVLWFAAVSFSLMMYHALFVADLVDEHIDLPARKEMQKRSYLGIILYGLSVVLAPISVYISLAIFFIVPIIYFIPQKTKFSSPS